MSETVDGTTWAACTEPEAKLPGVQVYHPHAKVIGSCSSGCDYECPNCGAHWRDEDPE